MKTCPKCRTTKEVSEFYRDKSRKDGRACYCKACYAAYQIARRKTPAGKAESNRYGRSMKGKATNSRYERSEKGRASERRRCTKHPVRVYARSAANHAIRAGKLPPPRSLSCACGVSAAEYHHPDYRRPLEVIAVCSKCHASLG